MSSAARSVTDVPDDTGRTGEHDLHTSELAGSLRPVLVRLTRQIRMQRSDPSVSLTQISAMSTLARHGPLSAGDLAAREGVRPPSMTKVLAALEEDGLVTRRSHPSDRRQAIVSLTTRGTEVLRAERRMRDEWLTQRLAGLSSQERSLLRELIPTLDTLSQD